MRSGRGLGRRGRGGIRSGRWRRSVRRRSSGRRRWAGVCSGEEEPSLALPPPSRESQRRNPFPTCRLVERSPGDGSGIDAETPARVHPNGHVGLPGAVWPREWKAGENARNPPGKAATKQSPERWRVGEDSGIQRVMCTPRHHMTIGPTTEQNPKGQKLQWQNNQEMLHTPKHNKYYHCYVRNKTGTITT
jgi:hypothetical protein